MPYADREREREYQRGRSSPDTPFDRSTDYIEAERRRPPCVEICNDLRRRHCELGWLGLSNERLRDLVRQELHDKQLTPVR